MRLSGTKATAIHQYRGLGNQLWDLAGNRPSLDLRFAESKSLVDATTGTNLIDFTRASSGTYVGSDGLIKTATTNLLLRSEEFDNTAWGPSNASVTPNQIAAPDGTTSADKLVENTANSTHRVASSASAATAGVYTFSVYLRAEERSSAAISLFTSAEGERGININLTNGTATSFSSPTSFSVVPAGNGWYRASVSVTLSAATTVTTLVYINFYGPYTGDGTSGIYLWGAQLEQSSTVGEYIPTTSTINSAPRFDHDPTTGESLGLLVEESRTNYIRNNTMVGAVAGTPGTPPTNWTISFSADAVTRSIVGVGVENGISYVDVKFAGTPTASSAMLVIFEQNTQIAAANGQTWTGSTFYSLAGGSTLGVSNLSQTITGRDSSGNQVAGQVQTTTVTPTSGNLAEGRVITTFTFSSASVAFTRTALQFNYTTGVAIDITLRIGLPQLELGAFPTSAIPTEGSTVTRAADVASITGTNFSSWYRQDEGTMFVEGAVPIGVGTSRALLSIDDNSNAERIQIRHNSTTARTYLVVDNSSTQFSAPVVGGSFPPGEYRKLAMAVKANDFAAVTDDAGTVATGTGTMPTPTQLQIGNATGNPQPCKPIKRITFWPARLPNETLSTITQ